MHAHLYNLSVACDIGNFEVESHAALLCSLQIARSTQFQVGFGNAKTIVGLTHDVYALARLFSQFGCGHKDAVALFGTSAHTSDR